MPASETKFWELSGLFLSVAQMIISLERVEKYERLFDEAAISHDPEKLRLLDAYYTSGEWREDYEADERGDD